MKYLIEEAECPPDPEGEAKRTPLMLAANWGASGSMNSLLNLGANPSLKDSRGRTAMDWARDKAMKSALEEAMKMTESATSRNSEGRSDDHPFHKKNISDVENAL